MSFSSKRLRVQIPCGEGTVFEEAFGCPGRLVCQAASFFCDPDTCVAMNSAVGAEGVESCEATVFNCHGAATPEPPGRRALLLDAEDLPTVRRALESQVEEIDRAEKALKDRGSDK